MMKFLLFVMVFVVVVLGLVYFVVFVGSYVEVGDVGDIVFGLFQVVIGGFGEIIMLIIGVLGFFVGIFEVDVFKIYIVLLLIFLVLIMVFVFGFNNFDIQFFFFFLNGMGIVGNDDDGVSGGF